MSRTLTVEGLATHFHTRAGVVKAVDDVSFSVRAGETLAIVGESGCGKSITALSLIRLIPTPPGRIMGGSVTRRQKGGGQKIKVRQASIKTSVLARAFGRKGGAEEPYFGSGSRIL